MSILPKIVVAEYPRSGGSWVTSMLGDALQLPKRDIYVGEDYEVFDVRKHPWYEGVSNLALTESCVIKSHEPPNSPLISFPAQFIHLVRDGRDVIVSKYYYEKEFCVKNGIYEQFEMPFDEYVSQVATEWRTFILAWLNVTPYTYRYEDFLQNPINTLQKALGGVGVDVSDSQVRHGVATNTKSRFKRSLDNLFSHNTFVRKGVAGDWRNHFGETHIHTFKRIAGDVLIRLGYEKDLNWDK